MANKTKNNNPKDGDLRVWHIPQVPYRTEDEIFHWSVQTPEEGKSVIDALGFYDLFLEKHGIRDDYSNANGLEVFEAGEWLEWSDENGWTIDDLDQLEDDDNDQS